MSAKPSEKKDFKLLPLGILFFLFPLVMVPVSIRNRYAPYPFAPDKEVQFDLYLVGKEYLLFILALWILLILIVYFRKEIRFRDLLPGLLFSAIILISSLVSVDKDLSFNGANELFQPFPVLLSYIIIFYGTYYIPKNGDRIKNLRFLFLSAAAGSVMVFLMGLIRFLQGKGAASSLYNPDYAGSYEALILPVLLVITLFADSKDKTFRLLFGLTTALSIIMLILSSSAAGMGGAAAGALMGILLFLMGGDRKKLLISVVAGIAVLMISAVLIYFNYPAAPGQEDFSLVTGGSHAEFSLKGDRLSIRRELTGGDNEFSLLDKNNDPVSVLEDPENNTLRADLPEDSVFYGIHFNPIELKSGKQGFMVFFLDRQWYFGEDPEGNTRILNAYGNYTDFEKSETAGIFTGRESLLHGRGYFWDRTLPILFKHPLFGCGPDAFPAVFPQNDIEKVLSSGLSYEDLVLKPHSFYLQTAAQLGIPCLILFLVSMICILIRLTGTQSQKGSDAPETISAAALFGGLIGFLTASLINDSTLCVTPLFMALSGMAAGLSNPLKTLDP